MFEIKNSIWLTWEHQRRSIELSQEFGVDYFEVISDKRSISSKIMLIVKTIQLINKLRPDIVFAQNPSNILAALVCFLAKFYNFSVIVDRHSNFIFSESDADEYSKLGVWIGNVLSSYSLSRADLTIVTNQYIKNIVLEHGGDAVILPDKFPELSKGVKLKLNGKYNIVFPCTFSPDEPVEEVVRAAGLLDKDIMIYVTGNYKKFKKLRNLAVPDNLIFTGFLSEKEYQSYLLSGDIVLALTKREHTLLCSAYEAVSLKKPLVISDKDDLKEYFNKGTVRTDNSCESIAASIKQCIEQYYLLSNLVNELHDELSLSWGKQKELLMQHINMIDERNKS